MILKYCRSNMSSILQAEKNKIKIKLLHAVLALAT